MVFDSIDHAFRYFNLGKGIETALRYFIDYNVESHQPERVYLDGNDLFINRATFTTAHNQGALMEAHRAYIDVMFIASGEERFYTKPLARLETITTEYDAATDASLGLIDSDATSFRFPNGYFCIFFPEDAHCAGQIWDLPEQVKKLIAKVKLDV